MSFQKKYESIKEIAKPEIKFIEKYMIDLINTREPLKSGIIEFLTAPSKRIRPLLSILFYKSIYGKISEEQLKILCAVELVHSASLVHDDIIDESDTRRGLKTINARFGNKLGVIAGDYILSAAMNLLSKSGSLEIMSKFSETLNKMCLGEINQNFDRFKIGTIEEYIEKSKNKTAYLFETALYSPFMLNNEDTQPAREFGINIGIAFQIRDDLQNLKNTDESKPVQNDISEGIYNAPVIFAASIENYHTGVEKTKALLNNYVDRASEIITNLPKNIYRQGLEDFMELLKND